MRIQSLRDQHLFFPDIDGYWNSQDLAETEKRIRAALPFGESVTSSSEFEAITQAVRLFCLQNKMKQAKEFLTCAEQYLKDFRSEDTQKLKVRYFLEEGRYHSLSMNPTKAIASFRSAWNLVYNEKKLDYLAIDTAYMISITLPHKLGNEWFKTALEIAEDSEIESLASRWRSYLYMQAGWHHFDSHDFLSSLSYFEKAQTSCDKDNNFLADRVKWCLARAQRANGQIDNALILQNEIIAGVKEGSDTDGFVYLEIAECLQAKQEFDKAAVNFERAYEILKENKWYSENCSDDLNQILKKSKRKKYH